MKRRDAVKTLDATFTKLTNELTKTRFEAEYVTSLFKGTITQLEDSLQTAKEFKKSKALDSSVVMGLWIALPIVDLTASKIEWLSVGTTKAEDDEILDALICNLRTQHQWLLVEAFEILESYLKDLYGVLGYLDRSLWRCSDFGNITPAEIGDNDLEWHKNQVRKTAKNNTKEIRKRISDKIDGVSNYLSNNCRQRDYSFLIGCIETLRHVIVHSSGLIDWNDLLDAVSKNTGEVLTGDKKGPKSLRKFLRSFVDSTMIESVVEITLINKANIQPPFHFINKPFLYLLEHIGSYGALLYSQSLRHFGKEPYWCRTKQ
jgi:hypothetical protein